MRNKIIATLIGAVVMAASVQAEVIIADLKDDFLPTTPGTGWAYKWNPTDVQIGDSANYVDLAYHSGGDYYWTTFWQASQGADYTNAVNAPQQATLSFVYKDGALNNIVGGVGTALSTDGYAHYAIAAYTLQPGEGGNIRLDTGGNSGSAGEVIAYVNNSQIGIHTFDAAGSPGGWTLDLGTVNDGDTVYVAFRGDDTAHRNDQRWYADYSLTNTIPEPATLGLMSMVGIGLAAFRRLRRK